MTGLQLATLILWALAMVASVLGMGARERTFGQGFLFALAVLFGLTGAFTFTLLLIVAATS